MKDDAIRAPATVPGGLPSGVADPNFSERVGITAAASRIHAVIRGGRLRDERWIRVEDQ